MKLVKKYSGGDATVPYLLDTGDGQYCKSEMPASVAEEVVRRAEARAETGVRGYEVGVDDMLFPAQAFSFEEGEFPTPAPKKSSKGK